MSVYEYKCRGCRKTFEIREPITKHGDRTVRCPNCRSGNIERHWGEVNVVTSRKS